MLKTFKGKYINQHTHVNESILSSTKTGAESVVKDFIEKYFRYVNRYTLKSGSIIVFDNPNCDFSFKHIPSHVTIPVSVEKCITLEYDDNANRVIKLPKEADTVIISNCKNLEELIIDGQSIIKELIIEKCEKIDFLNDLQGLECERVTIKGCNITTLSALKNISTRLTISGCKKLKNFDFESKNPINIKISSCRRIKNFNKINCNKLEINSLSKTNDLSLDIVNMSELYIFGGDFENIELKGNSCNVVVIEECEELKSLSTVDCKKSISLVDLPKLEEYNFPSRFSGIIVLDNVKKQPEVNCKKIINR
jgi:hypothetical protein